MSVGDVEVSSGFVGEEARARDWCERVASYLPVQHIENDGPYLDRFFACGYQPGRRNNGLPSVFLHHFLDSDRHEELHDHPWDWSVSLILAGGYREQRCGLDGQIVERDFVPGDTNVLRSGERHRVDLLADDCWSLFMAGAYSGPWGFFAACGGGAMQELARRRPEAPTRWFV